MATDSDSIISEATIKYKKAKDGWSDIFTQAKKDLHFISDEPYAQWNEQEAAGRTKVNRPVLTIDQLGQFIHQVTNDIRMNTPTINVVPDGDGADLETAEIYKGLIKAIEYNSKADIAYDTAVDFSVKSSIGFIRVDHDFTASSEKWEQELIIKRVVNPQSIFLDPDSTEADGSDAKFAFALEEMTKKEFEKCWPKATALSFGDDNPNKNPNDSDKIVIAEYFVLETSDKELGLKDDGTIEEVVKDFKYKQTRKTASRKIRRYKLAAQDVLEETTFPGIYIPIVPVYGEEAWIEGERHLYSLIRKSKDAQSMYNLWKSLETELLLKQPQAPVMAAIGQMRGFEADWKTPEKAMVLYYHQTDANKQPAPAPQRLDAPTIPTGIVNAARETVDDIKATMGLYNASLGAKSNETSGVAINQRKQEGDVATFHFGDNLVRSVTQVGKILVFAIPEVYDTARIIKIVGQEDEVKQVAINGANPVEEQKRAFDLSKGKYNVRVITGAPFTTQRQEAAAMYNELIKGMPELMPIIGDLVFKYQDTAGAQAVSARLKKVVDPKYLSPEERKQQQEDGDPQIMQLQQQLQMVTQTAQQEIQKLQQQLESKQADTQIKMAEVQLKSKEVDIKGFEAQTKATEAQKDTPIVDNSAELALKQRDLDIKEYQAKEDSRFKELELTLDAEKLKLEALKLQMTPAPQSGEGNTTEPAQATDSGALNAIIQSINLLQQTLAQQTAAMQQPITFIRDDQGNLQGAT